MALWVCNACWQMTRDPIEMSLTLTSFITDRQRNDKIRKGRCINYSPKLWCFNQVRPNLDFPRDFLLLSSRLVLVRDKTSNCLPRIYTAYTAGVDLKFQMTK